MGAREDIAEATRSDVLSDWIASRCISTTADRFGLPTKAVRSIVDDAARVARLPENVKADIHGEVLRLQKAMDVLWPRVMDGELRAIETWRKLGVDLRLLTGWQAPASSGFHLSVNVAQVTTGSAKLEALLDSLMALPAPVDEADHPN